MREKTKKATFSLHADVLAALDEAMSRGTVPSKNALVEVNCFHNNRAISVELVKLCHTNLPNLNHNSLRKQLWEYSVKRAPADASFSFQIA